MAGKAAAEAARDAARRAAESDAGADASSAEELAKAHAELATIRSQKESAAKAAEAQIGDLQNRISELESTLQSAAEPASSGPDEAAQEKIAELEATVAKLQAGQAASGPSGGGSGGAQTAIVLQTIRSTIDQHKNRIQSDEDTWKQKEVAIGNAIQQLLAMVQKDPSNRDMVYGLLNDLQGILDAGRGLVKRNRQFVDEESNAISELEKNL